jgi:hypothetical protein
MLFCRRARIMMNKSELIKSVSNLQERQLALQDQSPRQPASLDALKLTRQKELAYDLEIRIGTSALPVTTHKG